MPRTDDHRPKVSGSDLGRWAMIPKEVITSSMPSSGSTQARAIAFLVYCYIDLQSGVQGYDVKGFRYVARAIGLQPRVVAEAARRLAADGLIELVEDMDRSAAAVMRIAHNPARRKINKQAKLGPTPSRYRHETLAYAPRPDPVHGVHGAVHSPHDHDQDPDASDAPGLSSPSSEWLSREAADLLLGMLAPGPRCDMCLQLVAPPASQDATAEEFCSCPFQ